MKKRYHRSRNMRYMGGKRKVFNKFSSDTERITTHKDRRVKCHQYYGKLKPALLVIKDVLY